MTKAARSLRLAPVLALAALSAAGCAGKAEVVSGYADDYRARHPIVVTESTRDLDILVASSDTRLTLPDQTRVADFASRFHAARAAAIRMQVPVGGRNEAAAAHVSRSIGKLLEARGISPRRILVSRYVPQVPGEATPIRLSFNAVTARVEEPCGQWPDDLGDTYQNRNYHNFGCASQSNLAAQVSDPRDLLGPRGLGEVDAERRTRVIENYRQGQRTGATTPSQESNYDW